MTPGSAVSATPHWLSEGCLLIACVPIRRTPHCLTYHGNAAPREGVALFAEGGHLDVVEGVVQVTERGSLTLPIYIGRGAGRSIERRGGAGGFPSFILSKPRT